MDFGSLKSLYITISTKSASRVEICDGDFRLLDRDLDRRGHVGILVPDHLYGFEDVLMAHRAAAMRFKCAVVPEVRLRNIRWHSSLDVTEHEGERTRDHIERLHPEYERRIRRIRLRRGCYVVGANGEET